MTWKPPLLPDHYATGESQKSMIYSYLLFLWYVRLDRTGVILVPRLQNRREWSKTHQEQASRKNSLFVQWSLNTSIVHSGAEKTCRKPALESYSLLCKQYFGERFPSVAIGCRQLRADDLMPCNRRFHPKTTNT